MELIATETKIRIVDYRPEHASSFRELNEQWISRYFVLEDIDRRMLDHPQEYILDRGGYIFIAYHEDEIAGTCALVKVNDLTFELAKMAVAEKFRGKGIGHALGLHCLRIARATGIRKIELLSNTVLAPAISLYRKLGFTEVALPATEYQRANIKMEINLQQFVKASVIVADDLPPGLAINAAALVTSTLGNRMKHLIGGDVKDLSGDKHAGLTWLPITILKASRDTLSEVHRQAIHDNDILVIDVPEQAQMTRTYEDFESLMSQAHGDAIRYLAIGLYGDKSRITALTKKISLYK